MTGPAHILVVDDDVDVRGVVLSLLESEGHQVIEAADGRLALDAVASSKTFDLIILDMMMPVMDGATFLEHMSRGPHASVPVVIFSSSPFDGLERFANVNSVVPKLDAIEGLLAAIRNVNRVEHAPRATPGAASRRPL